MINALIALVSLALVAVVVYDLIEIGKRRKAIALETQKVKAVEEAAKKQGHKRNNLKQSMLMNIRISLRNMEMPRPLSY